MATTKARATKAQATQAAQQAAPAAAPVALYTLSAQAIALANQGTAAAPTLQALPTQRGQAWRAAGHKAPNTRAAALAAVMALPQPFTFAAAKAALAAAQQAGLNLGTGSPNSYARAFVANGYFAPATA